MRLSFEEWPKHKDGEFIITILEAVNLQYSSKAFDCISLSPFTWAVSFWKFTLSRLKNALNVKKLKKENNLFTETSEMARLMFFNAAGCPFLKLRSL